MTLRDLLDVIGGHPALLYAVLGAPAVLALLLGLVLPRGTGDNAPWKYLYSVLVYVSCVPGMMAAVVTGYLAAFTRKNLMDLNASVYLLPIATMIVTLILIGRKVAFRPLPGFGRLSGLMTVIGLSFGAVILISKTRIFLFFGGTIWTLILFCGFAFALMKWGIYMAFRERGAPEKPAPQLPGLHDERSSRL